MPDTSSLGLGPLANKKSPRAKTVNEEKTTMFASISIFSRPAPKKERRITTV